MKITIKETESDFDRAAADIICTQMESKPDSVICLSTGRTTGNMHRLVAEHFKCRKCDLSKITILGLDEILGVPKEYSGSCYTMLYSELVKDLNIPLSNFIMLPTSSDDYIRSCEWFTKEIERRNGIDLLILGLGENGHLGFNQPGTNLDSKAHLGTMLEELETRVRRETGLENGEFLGGLTLGIKDIMAAKRIVLVAKGKNKTEIVGRMMKDEISSQLPATVLRRHPNCEFLFDKEAAAQL